MIVAIEVVAGGVVGNEEIEPPVAIYIGPDGAESKTTFAIGDACFSTDVGKRSVAIVMKQRIARTGQSFWAALDGDAAILAEVRFAKFRKFGKVYVNVVGHEEIQIAVFVIVGHGSPVDQRVSSTPLRSVTSVKVPFPLL